VYPNVKQFETRRHEVESWAAALEISRNAKATPRRHPASLVTAHGGRGAIPDPITIKYSSPADRAAILRLAALDGRTEPDGAMLLAFASDELRAALPLAGGDAIADPFYRSGELVTLLRLRESALRKPARTRGRLLRIRLAFSSR